MLVLSYFFFIEGTSPSCAIRWTCSSRFSLTANWIDCTEWTWRSWSAPSKRSGRRPVRRNGSEACWAATNWRGTSAWRRRISTTKRPYAPRRTDWRPSSIWCSSRRWWTNRWCCCRTCSAGRSKPWRTYIWTSADLKPPSRWRPVRGTYSSQWNGGFFVPFYRTRRSENVLIELLREDQLQITVVLFIIFNYAPKNRSRQEIWSKF